MRTAPFLAAIFLVCCFNALGQQPPVAAAPDAKRAGAVMDAILAAEKATHNKRYRAEIRVTGDTGKVEVQTEEFETEQRFHLTTSAAEVILLPNGAWARIAGENEWSELEAEQANTLKRYQGLVVFCPPQFEELCRCGRNHMAAAAGACL